MQKYRATTLIIIYGYIGSIRLYQSIIFLSIYIIYVMLVFYQERKLDKKIKLQTEENLES